MIIHAADLIPLALYIVLILLAAAMCCLWIELWKSYMEYGENLPPGTPHPPPPRQQKQLAAYATVVLETYSCKNSKEGDLGGCAICLEEYKDDERRAVVATCNHRFHAACIEAWLLDNSTCPLCRSHLV